MADEPEATTSTNVKVITVVTYLIILCFALASFWAFVFSADTTIKGSVMGTWSSLATMAGGYWLGTTVANSQRKDKT